ncbi:MAG: alkaline phosphatase family protein [Acidobacteriota bacterium]
MSRPSAPLLVTLLLAVLGASCRPSGSDRIIVIGLDGLDPQTVELLLSEGKLPNLARIRREGAHGRLKADPPLLSPVLWTTLATGRQPLDHGIGHFTARDEATGEELPVTSGLRRVRAIWNLFSDAEREVAVVGWWATWPAEKVLGSLVTDHLCYHFLFPEAFTGAPPESAANTYPPELERELAPLVLRPQDLPTKDLVEHDTRAGEPSLPNRERAGTPFAFTDEVNHLRWALATAETYRRVGLHLWATREPELLMVYFEATDTVSHLFGHLFRTEGLAGNLAAQQERFGNAVEATYLLADEILGDYLDAADDRTTLIVVSDHGFKLGELPTEPPRAGDMRRVSSRFHRPHGVIHLWGRAVQPGARVEGAHQLDLVPTVLALAGLPAAEDMPGRVLREALTLTDAEIPARIPTHETGQSREAGSSPSRIDPAVLEKLEALGYIGASSPSSDRAHASMVFSAGRHEEAERLFAELVAQHPEDASLRASWAGALGALDRPDEAMKQLEAAIALDPLRPEAHHNLAVLAERRGDRDQAITSYREALRYAPGHEPSRIALRRLTGSAKLEAASGEDEKRALQLTQQARELAQHDDLVRAGELLEEATRLAPRLVVVQQYRSNVAYLAGDLATAQDALERALELEPGNALFRRNLESLKKQASDETGGSDAP